MFEELHQDGPDHSRLFVYQVIIDERTFEKGSGTSKSKAKKTAALNALNELYNMPIQMRKFRILIVKREFLFYDFYCFSLQLL